MPVSDFTSNLLELKDAIVTNVSSTNEEVHIHFHLKRKPCSCPVCGAVTEQIHDYRTSIHLLRNRYSAQFSASLVGISVSSVFRFFQLVHYPKPMKLPKVLSIDEFKGNSGGEKFQAILTDAHNHKLFDILPSRKQTDLMQYLLSFKNRKEVQYIIMDMNTVYRDIAKEFFPNATLVIDKFHVVRYVTWALENVRKRIQKQLHPSKRKYFKRSRKLQHFLLAAQVSNLPEFKPCLTMLGNWTRYILNAFDCPYTNGYTEGTNNAIKVIKRNAFGYRNFNNFRNRIFLALT